MKVSDGVSRSKAGRRERGCSVRAGRRLGGSWFLAGMRLGGSWFLAGRRLGGFSSSTGRRVVEGAASRETCWKTRVDVTLTIYSVRVKPCSLQYLVLRVLLDGQRREGEHIFLVTKHHYLRKLDGVAQLLADPPGCHSTTKN